MLRIDETQYDDDADMQRIVQRLLMAASDSQLRQDMNVEDEYFSAIETRDTAIMNRDAKIKKLDAELEEKNSQLEEKNSQLEEKNSQLEEKDNQLEEKNSQLNEQRNQLVMSVRMLHNNGLSAEQISMSLGMGEETVRKMLE